MSDFQCPSCGRNLRVIPLSESGASSSWRAGQAYALGAGIAEGTSYSKETPVVNMSGINAAVKAPLAQSGITALAAGALAVVGVVAQGWHWTTPIVVVVAVFGASWFLLMTSNRRLLSVRETVDRSAEVEQVATFNVEVTESYANGQKRMTFAQFPVKERDVRKFAIAALNRRLTVHGGHGLGQGAFAKMRDECIGRGLLVWKNPHAHNQGTELTRVGSAVFKRLSD